MLYKDELLDHYHHPQNYGPLKKASNRSELINAACGDEIQVELLFEEGKVSQIGFTGRGCAVSTAAASLVTELVKGKDRAQIQAMGLDDVVDLMGELSPGRQKCALLPLEAIKLAIKTE
jgi:nitrogen fixation NifU-like protein